MYKKQIFCKKKVKIKFKKRKYKTYGNNFLQISELIFLFFFILLNSQFCQVFIKYKNKFILDIKNKNHKIINKYE